VTGPGVAATVVTVGPSRTGIDLKFAESLTISGKVTTTARTVVVTACGSAAPCGKSIMASDGRFRIAVDAGAYLVRFAPSDGRTLPGYLGTSGLVADKARARSVEVKDTNVADVVVTLRPIAAAIRGGQGRTGIFGTKAVTVARNGFVTVRFTLGRGFSGMRVVLQVAKLDAAGKPGTFRNASYQAVGSDGLVFFSLRIKPAVALRASYKPPSEFAPLVVTSAFVVARSR